VSIMFFDFSGAFNTVQPALLCRKLQKKQVDVSIITDYLTNRPQFVRLKGFVSEKVVSRTGAPQGSVLSLFLFTPSLLTLTPQTLITTQNPVIYKNTLMTLQLLGVSLMDKRMSTENWSITLWHGMVWETSPHLKHKQIIRGDCGF